MDHTQSAARCKADHLQAHPLLQHTGIELDTNTAERAIRPITLGRKNHLFAGSDGGAAHWATVCYLISTAKPFAYLKDVLERMSSGHP